MSELNAATDKDYDDETRRMLQDLEEYSSTPDPQEDPAPQGSAPQGAAAPAGAPSPAAPTPDRATTRTWGEAPAAAWEMVKHSGKMFAQGSAGLVTQAVGTAGLVVLPKFVRDQMPDLGVGDKLGLRTNVDPLSIRKNAADTLEGLFGLVSSPFEVPLQAVAIGVDKLTPEQAEQEVLPGGKGSLSGSLRRLINAPIPGSGRSLAASALRVANVPHQIAQAVRGEGLNPTPEEAERLDAPMTLGEFAKNATLLLLMTRGATTTGARAAKTVVAGVKEGIPKARAERAAAKAADAEAKTAAEGKPAQETVAEPLAEGPVPGMYEKARGVIEEVVNPAQSGVTFTTAKGSKYTVVEGGTTVRDKAARPEHPGDSGVKAASEKTFYIDENALNSLGEFQTRGGSKKVLAQTQDGKWGIKYVDGPDAGKFERRTVVSASTDPKVGLYPVEVWEGGANVHFGNKITEVSATPLQGLVANAADLVTRAVVETLLEPDATKLPERLTGMLEDTGLPRARAAELGPRLAEAFAEDPGLGLLANRLDIRPRLDAPRVPDRNPVKGGLEVQQLITDMTKRLPKIVEGTPALKAAEGSGVTYKRLLERDLIESPLNEGELAGARSLEAAAAEHVATLADRVLTGQGRPGELVQALLLLGEVSKRASVEKPRFRLESPTRTPPPTAEQTLAGNQAARELAARMTKEGASRPEINDAIRALKNEMGLLSQRQQVGGKLVQLPAEGSARRAALNEQIARMADNFDPAITDQGLGHLVSLVNEVHGPPGVMKFSRLLHNWGQAGIDLWYASVLAGKAPFRAAASNVMLGVAEMAVAANAPYMPKGLWRVTMDEGWAAPGATPRGAAKFVAGALVDPVLNRPRLIQKFKKYQEAHPELNRGKLWELTKFSAMRPEKLLRPGWQQGGMATAINWADFIKSVPFKLINGADLFIGKYPLFSGKARELSWRQAEIEFGPRPKGVKEAAAWETKMAEREAHYLDNLDQLSEPFQAELRRVPEEATLSNPPDLQMAQSLITALNSGDFATGILRIQTVPFFRTMINGYETFASFTPGLNLASARFWNAMKEGGPRAQRAFAQLDVGLGVYAILSGMVEEGAFTGDGPLDPSHRRLAKFAEGPNRSIRVPGTDHAVSYRGTPAEPMLAFVANAHRALSAVPVEAVPQFMKIFALTWADALSSFDFLGFLGTFGDLFDQNLAPDQRLNGVIKGAKGLVGNFFSAPAPLRELRQTLDPTVREVFTQGTGLEHEAELWLREQFNSTPGLSTAVDAFGNPVVPARRDPLFGDPDVEYNVPFVAKVAKVPEKDTVKHRVWSEFLRVGARITPVSDFLIPGRAEGADVLTPQQSTQPTALPLNLTEQDRLVVLMTQELKDGRGRTMGAVLDAMIQSEAYQKQSAVTQATQLELIVNKFRTFAKAALLKENAELRKDWELVEGENTIRTAPPERQPGMRQQHHDRVKTKFDLGIE